MKRTNIDATQLELADTVVAIKRVSRPLRVDVPCVSPLWL